MSAVAASSSSSSSSSSRNNNNMSDSPPSLTYRSIQRSDKDAMRRLHDEFFPVKYTDAFYNEMIEERGMHGLPLFTVIAVDESRNEVIGFILAQLLEYPVRSEDVDLFQFGQSPAQICYILTLGVKSEYRRFGIASILIGKCIEFAGACETCGAVYLHVIHYNTAALNLYRKNRFIHLRTLHDFYLIDGKYYTAELYIYYLNNYGAPFILRLFETISTMTEVSLSFVSRVFTSIGIISDVDVESGPQSADAAEATAV